MKKKKVIIVILICAIYFLAPYKFDKYLEDKRNIMIRISEADMNAENGWKDQEFDIEEGTEKYQKMMALIHHIYCHRMLSTYFKSSIQSQHGFIYIFTGNDVIALGDLGTVAVNGYKYALWDDQAFQQFKEILLEEENE